MHKLSVTTYIFILHVQEAEFILRI